MKNTFISFLFLATLSLLLSSCTKENNGIDTPTEELKEVEDVCTQMDDINFMNFCYTNFDVNKDGKVSMIEANAVSYMSMYKHATIKSLKGIEYFQNLTTLVCAYHNLTSLDVSSLVNLEELYCENNDLKSLNISNLKNLTALSCGNNDLTSINISGANKLQQLSCYNNKLTSLDISESADLFTLKCNENQLTTIDISRNTRMLFFNCLNNPLTLVYMNKEQNSDQSFFEIPEGVKIEYLDL